MLSIAAAVVTISLKLAAFALTGSVGLFSDAAESVINLVAAVAALIALTVAARPPDEEHPYGHTKAEYFSSGLESALIMLAAGGIAWAAGGRLFNPQPLDNIGAGAALAVVATAINGGVALVLLRAGARLRSIALRADAHHLLTDVWTSVGVVVGVVLVQFTGWWLLDPVIALLVAVNIIWTGVRLLRETAQGLLDTALPPADQATLQAVLARYQEQGITFHAIRTRIAGPRRFVSLHVIVPGAWTVQAGHDLCEQIEAAIRAALPQSTVFTHLEPREDPLSWEDQDLDRAQTAREAEPPAPPPAGVAG